MKNTLQIPEKDVSRSKPQFVVTKWMWRAFYAAMVAHFRRTFQ